MQKDLKSLFGEFTGLDDKSLEFLTKALEKHNLPNFDFIEFKQAVGALMAMGLDQSTAFKSAFATGATMGCTKEKLAETAGYYRNVVLKEKDQFEEALKKQLAQRVDGKIAELKKWKEQVERDRAEIQRVQDEIASLLGKIESADKEIDGERAKIVKLKEGFDFTHQSVLNQIDRDVENLHKLL